MKKNLIIAKILNILMKFSTPGHLFYERYKTWCVQCPGICSTLKTTCTAVHNQLVLCKKGSCLAICTGSIILCLEQ